MSRVRSTTTGAFSVVNHRLAFTRPTCGSGWSQFNDQVTQTGEVYTKVITDVLTPGFRSLLKCGKFLPLNPVEIVETTETRVAGDGLIQTDPHSGCYHNYVTGPAYYNIGSLVSVPPFDEDLVDTVVTQAIAESREATFDSLTFVVELDQVADLFRTNWGRITDIAEYAARQARRWSGSRVPKEARKIPRTRAELDRAIQAGKRAGTRRRAKRLRDFRRFSRNTAELFANLWLEYSFGWAPLVRDIDDAVRALSKRIEGEPLREGKAKLEVSLSDQATSSVSYFYGTETTTTVINGSRTYRGHAYGTSVSNGARFGFDPFVTAWEEIPWSFLVDYALEVGTWIQSVSPFSGVKSLGSCGSVKDEYTVTTTYLINFNAGGYTGVFTGNTSTKHVKSYNRFPHSGGVLPSWNPRFTAKRIANIIALVFLGRRRVNRALTE